MRSTRIAIVLLVWPLATSAIDWADEVEQMYLQHKRTAEQVQRDWDRSQAQWNRQRAQQEELMRQVQEGRWGSTTTFPPEINVNVRGMGGWR